MNSRTRLTLASLATSVLLLTTSPALPVSADPAEPIVVDVPSSSVVGIAIDGDLLYVEGRDFGSGNITRRTLSFETGAASPELEMDDGFGIVAGDGQLAWKITGRLVQSRSETGVTSTIGLYDAELTQVTRGWLLNKGTAVVSIPAGRTRTSAYQSAILDGVHYSAGASWIPSRATVLARELATGATEVIPAPTGCSSVSDIQVAGSWMLMTCPEGRWVVDRTGFVNPFTIGEITGTVMLGNGFIAVHSGTTLSWSDLSPGTMDLRTLSTTARISTVSRGVTPSLAWADDTTNVHAALLPVAASALPRHPAGPSTAPAAPQAVAMSSGGTITLSWPAAAAGEEITHYVLARNGLPTETLPASTRSYVLSGLDRNTTYFASITAVNTAGTSPTTLVYATTDPEPDTVSPTASMADLDLVTLGKRFSVTATAADDRALASVDIRLRSASAPTKAIGAWTYPVAWQGLTGSYTVTPTAKPGATYCVAARARDTSGNLSAWTAETCTAIALDDSVLQRSGSWQKYRSSKYFSGAAQKLKGSKSSLSIPVRSSKLYVVATTCPTCGKIGVRFSGDGTWLIDLRSRTTLHRQVIQVPRPGTFTGTVKIVQWGSNKAMIDGLAVRAR